MPTEVSSVIHYPDSINYRLIVFYSPCYYEYRSHQFGGIGSFLDTSSPPRKITIRGYDFHKVTGYAVQKRIVMDSLESCERERLINPLGFKWDGYPWLPDIFNLPDCFEQVDAKLIEDFISTRVYPSGNNENEFVQLSFFMNRVFINDEMIK